MKVKEVDRTANIAWSPVSQHPIYLAAGTAAQQLDASFSTTATLELYDLNLHKPGYDMNLIGSVSSEHRFHKIVWDRSSKRDVGSGLLVGGTDNGSIMIYDSTQIISGEDSFLEDKKGHSGPVYTLDFNKFQDYLLASGSVDSEICISDLNLTQAPMPLGTKLQPAADVMCVAWNHQSQHVLASAFPTRCVVWDLRKAEPIIKVSDAASRMRCKVLAWHPCIATQMCIASDDDHSPVIQLWDLRFATSPLRTLENHRRGILSMAWCQKDPDLLISCGKDNRILIWNPNTPTEGGDLICEMPTSDQWSFDLAWCLRNPDLIAGSSCDGRVSVFSLLGGQPQAQCSSKIAESFPGIEKSTPHRIAPPGQRPQSVCLRVPPKWMRRPVGASFGFGGKLVTFNQRSGNFGSVQINQVVTEHQFLSRATSLENAWKKYNLNAFCTYKTESAKNEQTKIKWEFLKCSLSDTSQNSMLTLLGYDTQDIKLEVDDVVDHENSIFRLNSDNQINGQKDPSVEESNDGVTLKDLLGESINLNEGSSSFPKVADNLGSLLNKALLTGNVLGAVQLCIKENKWTDALILAHLEGHRVFVTVQMEYFKHTLTASRLIPAISTGDLRPIVENCSTDNWRGILSAIISYAKKNDFFPLAELLGTKMEEDENEDIRQYAELCYIASLNFQRLGEHLVKHQGALNTPNDLQSAMEKIMIMYQVAMRCGYQIPNATGALAKIMEEFCVLLASQGNLDSSIFFMKIFKTERLDVLKDRAFQAAGLQTPKLPYDPIEDVEETPAPSTSSNQNEQLATNPMTTLKQSFPVPPTRSLMFPLPAMPQYTHYFTKPVVQDRVPLAPACPPTESSALGNSSGAMSQQRPHRYMPKHMPDPCMYSEQRFSNPTYMPTQTYGHLYKPLEYQISSDMGSTGPSHAYGSFSSQAPIPTSAIPPHSQAPHVHAGPSTVASMAGNSEYESGWNDPPLLRQSVQSNPVTYETPAPITAPFPESAMPDIPQSDSRPPMANAIYGATYVSQPQTQHTPEPEVINQSIASAPKEKPPMPVEHEVVQRTLMSLLQQCYELAVAPQVKRKLDDVSKKLEYLFDQLRERSLSAAVTGGLHEIVEAVRVSEYNAALTIHGHLVATSNFSEISAFMPSLKVLLGTAKTFGCTACT